MDNLYSRDVKRFIVVKLRCVFFMRSKVCVHLTHVKLTQISQTYLKLFCSVRKSDKNSPRII